MIGLWQQSVAAVDGEYHKIYEMIRKKVFVSVKKSGKNPEFDDVDDDCCIDEMNKKKT